jgi:hypothetical protein
MARFQLRPIPVLAAVAAAFLGAAAPAEAGDRVPACGGRNQSACTVLQAVPSCDRFLYENLESCGLLCAQAICRDSACGGTDQRACVPFVDHGWPELCRADRFYHLGACRAFDADGYPEWCGDHEEEACSVDLQAFLGIPPCKPGHVEQVGLPTGTCYRIEEPGSCDPGLDAVRCHLDAMSLALATARAEDLSEKLRRKLERKVARGHGKLAEAKARAAARPAEALRRLRGAERQLEGIALLVEKRLAAPLPGIDAELAALLVGEASAALFELEVARAALEAATPSAD